MPVWLLLFVALLWAFGAWQCWRGLRLGKVQSAVGSFDRHRDALFFWPMFALYGAMTLAMPVLVLILAVSLGVRW